MAFHDVRLPDDVEQGASGGPTFQTTVLPTTNGAEQRNINWSEARHSWDVGYGIDNKTNYSAVRAFFFARRGMAHTFRFKDWSDFDATDEPQGIGDGVNHTFQLIRTYETDGPAPYFRRVTRPVTGTVVWKVDDVVAPATDNGLGSWTITTAPGDGAVVTASFEFDMCVRFDVDKFSLTLSQIEAGEIASVPVIEVRE